MRKKVLGIGLAAVFSMMAIAGCGKEVSTTDANLAATTAEGGVLYLKVNPEIAIEYDKNGNVTMVEARNDDGSKILENFGEYVGKDCNSIIVELVKKIGEAGYFVEEVEGEKRNITLEIEQGSVLPNDLFLEEIAEDIRECVKENKWSNPVDLEGESDYGYTEYQDTDYGVNNDGDTDYNTVTTVPDNNSTATSTDDGQSDYSNNSSGQTDYGQTDYVQESKPQVTQKPTATPTPKPQPAPENSSSNSDYDSTDYGPNSDGVTDYDSDSKNDSSSDYDSDTNSDSEYASGTNSDSNYDSDSDSDDGDSDYDD